MAADHQRILIPPAAEEIVLSVGGQTLHDLIRWTVGGIALLVIPQDPHQTITAEASVVLAHLAVALVEVARLVEASAEDVLLVVAEVTSVEEEDKEIVLK